MSSNTADQQYTVKNGNDTSSKYMIMKFNHNNNIDFTKYDSAKIHRENNLKTFKLSHDIDNNPKFGAGSEYGKEQKDLARRNKLGISTRHYSADEQPWLLEVGSEKRKLRGTKEGGIADNASYFVFMHCEDGTFEAHPVSEWYKFSPVLNYKFLNSEEAEEQFSRRDKTINYFSIMVNKRMKNQEEEEVETKEKVKTTKSNKEFKLTEMDEWAEVDSGGDDDDDDAGDDDNDGVDEKKKLKEEGKQNTRKKEKKKVQKKSKLKRKKDLEESASEESDSVDEGREVDYITSSDSDDDDMYQEKARQVGDKYQEAGVEDEDGLKKNSDEEEENDIPEDEEEGDEKASSGHVSSGSESETDLDKDVQSAILMRNKLTEEKQSQPAPGTSADAKKRKSEEDSISQAKKMKMTLPVSNSDGISEENVRRYLMRKPLQSKDLLKKFSSSNQKLTKQQMVDTLSGILKKIGPKTQKIKDKLYFSL